MANEREITIRIAAKNLTATEFAKARAEVLGLGDDADKAKGQGEGMGPSFTSSFKAIAAGAAIVVSAVGAIAAGVTALAVRGSDVADVHAQFDVLNRSVGNVSGSLLGTLRGAMAGTVSDFNLMKSVNLALSQGLKLNEDQFGLTGRAARVLADRVGGDSADAFDKLTMAMTTGQDKQLKSIGLNIDGEAAVKRHAAALGVQVGDLTEAEVITAKRNETLAEMERVLRESGDAEVDFADLVDQGKTALSNFVDGLSEGIATSPMLTAAIGPIGDAIGQAFGGSSQGLIRTIVGWVETGALAFVTMADSGLGAADAIVRGFLGVEARLASAAASAREFIASLPGATDEMKRLAVEMRQHADASQAAADGGNRFSSTVAIMRTGLQGARDAMLKAREEQAAAIPTTDALSGALRRQGAANDGATGGTRRLTEAQKDAEKQQKKLAEMVDAITTKEYFRKLGNEDLRASIAATNAEIATQLPLLAQTETVHIGVLQSSTSLASQMMTGLKPSIASATDELTKLHNAGTSLKTSLSNALKDVPNVILGALQGGGNVGKSVGASIFGSIFADTAGITKSITGGATKIFGKGFGDAIGAVIPGLGTLLGSSIGSLADKMFGKLFKSEGKQVNDLRDAFVGAAGGIHELNVKAQGAGLTLDRLLKAKNVNDYKAAVDELNAAFGKSEADMDLARQAMDEWGISATDAGQKFAQADMDKTAGTMLAKLKAATAAGVDLNAIVSKGGDDFGKMVHQAIKSGTTISNEFRPVLAAMLESKTLVDENGEAFTDLSQIPFAEDIGAGINSMSTSLRELVDFFKSGVSGAFKAAGDQGTDFASRVKAGIQAIPRSIEIEVNGVYNPPDIDGGNPGYAVGTKERHGSYFVNFGAGTNTRLHGYEAVLTPAQTPGFVAEYMRRSGGESAAPVNVYTLVEIDAQGQQQTRAISSSEYLRRKINQMARAGQLLTPARTVGAVA